jgi:outer membrane protein, heavy metal efflux system
MHRGALRWFWPLAAAWAGLVLPGCLPHVPDSLSGGHGGFDGRPRDLEAVPNMGPPQTLPPRFYDLEPAPKTTRPGKDVDLLKIPKELEFGAKELKKIPEKLPKDPAEQKKLVRGLYPPLPPLGPEIRPQPGPEGRPLTLADLQKIALANDNPVLARAAQDVEAARGTAWQAGLHPNPTVGYEADQVQPGPRANNNTGQQGFYINQLIKTGNKLQLAQAAAWIDVLNAEVALRQARSDLASRVRGDYFAVLVAQESLLISRALVELTENAFLHQVEVVRGGFAGAYEPLGLYVFAVTARTALTQARNRYVSAWKQLAATLNRRDLPYTELAGSAGAPLPGFRYDAIRDYVLANHTTVQSAVNTVLKAQYNLRLAEVTRLPDLQTNTVFQHDNSAGNFQFNVQLGVALPLWDRNQGNIYQARAQLARAQQDLLAIRNDLTRTLTDAFERYLSNSALVVEYRDKILPNQVSVYKAIRRRREAEPDSVAYADIITAQQNVASNLSTYLTLLAGQWTAVVDVANLLQTDELFVPWPVPGGGHGPLLPECLAPSPAVDVGTGRPAALGAPLSGSAPGTLELAPAPRLQVAP